MNKEDEMKKEERDNYRVEVEPGVPWKEDAPY